MKLSIFAVLILAFAANEVASQACHMREVDLCMAIGMFHFQSNGIPEDEERVDEFCETYNEVAECMGNFSSKCMSPLQKEVIGLFSGADERAMQLCTPGSDARARFLQHSECLAKEYEGENFKAMMKDLQITLERMFQMKFYDRLPTLCCGLNRFYSDLDNNARRACSDEAAEMVRYITEMIVTDIPSVICNRYEPESDECKNVLLPRGSPPIETKTQLGRLLETMFGSK